MNSRVRQRAMRMFYASLLQSDLTSREIRDLADDLAYGSFGRELGEYLQNMNLIMADVDRSGKSDFPSSQSKQGMAYDIVAKRKLTKKMVLQLMSLASPWIRAQQLSDTGSMKEMIEKYFVVAPQSEVSKFMNILEGEPADAYLKGISRRDRGR